MRFYYDPKYKYTNRYIIDVSSDQNYRSVAYENFDSPDTINGHIIYTLAEGETIPTYVVDEDTGKRWFVSGITQLRTGKHQLSLLRDIISESPNTWKSEQSYIAAGNASDYCKYKKWGLPFTNTKVGQQRLAINGKSSFFVYYVNEQTINGHQLSESDFQVEYTTLPGTSYYDVDLDNLNEIPNFNFVGAGEILVWDDVKGVLRFKAIYGSQETVYSRSVARDLSFSETTLSSSEFEYKLRLDTTLLNTQNIHDPNNSQCQYINNAIDAETQRQLPTLGTSYAKSQTDALDEYVGKVIRVKNPNDPTLYDFYRINSERTVQDWRSLFLNSETTLLTQALSNSNVLDFQGSVSFSNVGAGHFEIQGSRIETVYTLESLGTATTFNFTFKGDTRKLPKSNVRCVNIVADDDVSDNMIAQSLMMAQANPGVDAVEGSDANIGRIIDIQYLPFSIATTKNTNFSFGQVNATAEFLDNDDFIFTTTLPTLTNINKETDSIVIVSPSRKSQFKFSPYNNDGRMVFNTKITLRPNQSIIYVRPSTEGLLIQNWDDKDCLIIQEDFSLTTVNSAWTNYVYNNRNYQNAFNLTIQTKEFERGWERRIEQEQAKADEWTARNISSQKAQTYTGNLPIISGIAGAIGSAIADEKYLQMAQLDRQYNEALYQKSVEVAKQTFSYQIDNIKSQPLIPNTITVIDCKMLDGIYLEFYSTNSTELDSIAKFYLYNGNRIDNYGTFAQYWGNFVRGKIIISAHYTQPEIDELNRRLELGIFTGGI